MTPGIPSSSQKTSFLQFGVKGTPAARINFGNSVDAADQSADQNTDTFVRTQSDSQTSLEDIDKINIDEPNEVENPPDKNLSDTSKTSFNEVDFSEEEEPKKDFVAQLIESAKPIDLAEATVPVIQRLRSNSAEQLRQIMSRSHLNSAVITFDDEHIKKGVLAQLQSTLNDPPMLSLDCDGIEPEKGGFFNDKKQEYKLSQSLEEAIPQIEEKARLSGNQQQPLILLLENIHEDELSNLQSSKVYKKLQTQFPNVRFIIPTELSSESGTKSSWLDDDNGSGLNQWRAGQFQILKIPSLKPHEWGKVLKQDPFAKQVLNYWNIDASEETLSELFHVLKRENQDVPLTYDGLIAELDALGSFISPEVDKDNYPLTSQHIKTYTRKVLAERRNHVPTSGGPSSMGPPPYDTINSGDISVRMDDIVGHDEPKKILTQALRESKYPEFFEHLNAKDPDSTQSAVLLMGPPGGGKTMLAKAIAAQGGATFISTSGSRFVNGLVGGGANGIRRLRDAIEQAPDDLVVLFIDEMDALGSRSGMGGGEMGASGSEDLKTINEFLAFTDGVKKSNKRLLLIGATNRPEALDPAILSRFNRKLEISEMDRKQRQELLEKQMQQKSLHPDESVDIQALSKRTKGFSGRDIKNIIKNVKDKLIGKLEDDELEKLELDEAARKDFRLRPSHKDLMEGIRETKRSKRQIDENGDTGAYGGGDKQQNGGRKLYTITG